MPNTGSRPRSGWWDDNPETAREYHQPVRDSFTGLYNHLGEPLHREPEPFGFHPNRWNDSMKKTTKAPKKKGGKGC